MSFSDAREHAAVDENFSLAFWIKMPSPTKQTSGQANANPPDGSPPVTRSSVEGRVVGEALPSLGFLLLGALTVFWGLNWPAMKFALSEIPPWTFRMLCLVFGSVGFFVLVKVNGVSLAVPRKEIGPLILVSLMNITGWHLFTAHGLIHINAGRASIIAYTMPLWATALSRLILNERLTMTRLFGLGLGIAGLMALIGPDVKALGAAPAGAGLLLGAAISWAAGTVFLKYFDWTIPTSLLAGWQLALGGIPVVIGALILEPTTVIFQVSWKCTLAMVYVIVLPMIFCHWAWFKIVSLFPATIASIGTIMIPIIGLFSSALILGEPVGFQELAALALVVMALAIVMIRPRASR
jgi:drug/metabolite transporter (DMT)-like permease